MKHRGLTRIVALVTVVSMMFGSISVYANNGVYSVPTEETMTSETGESEEVTKTQDEQTIEETTVETTNESSEENETTGETAEETEKNAEKTADKTVATDVVITERIDRNYTKISSKYSFSQYIGQTVEIPIIEAYNKDSQGELVEDVKGYKESDKVVKVEMGDEATFVITAPKDGVYNVAFDFFAFEEKSILPVEFMLTLNGEIPFYEANRLVVSSLWSLPEKKSYDRYNNEIVTIPNKVMEWSKEYLSDASYRHSAPLQLELSKGDNVISLEVIEGVALIGNFYLEEKSEVPEYKQGEKASGSELIVIEAENTAFKNDSSIRPVCEYDPDLSPYKSSKKVLNIIDSASFSDAGMMVEYVFDVKKAGNYNIAFNYRQTDKVDFPVFADVRINGEILNKEMQSYPFAYQRKFDTLTMSDSKKGNNITVYLEEGVNKISLTLANDNVRKSLETIDKIMSEVNDLALDVVKVAGTNQDKYRTIRILEYIPDAVERLNGWAAQIDQIYKELSIYSDEENIGALSGLTVASRQLKSLADEPNQIPFRINELSQSTSSANQYLANVITELNKNNLGLDRIYIYQDSAELPAKNNIFVKIWEAIVRFIESFNDQAYTTDNKDNDKLQVWVNRPRQYLEIIQQMVDKYFTPETGIEVDLSMMPDAQKLILANAAGESPDVAQAIDYSQPFELAVRGALVDMTKFDDYQEVMQQFSPGILIPSAIGDSIYSIPETLYFWVLFYRTDILEKLGLEVPDTLEDVKNMIPELKNRGLEFFYPTAGTTGQRTFAMTTPILYQYGASVYDVTAGDSMLNTEAAINGFTELTELFTIYDLKSDVPSFYQRFRNGDMPIGVSDYFMYNLLINAAPEIENSWEIALVPGVVDEETGEVNRQTAGAAQVSSIMATDIEQDVVLVDGGTMERDQAAWEYLKWWMSTETQVEFGSVLQTTYGKEYIWNSANVEAFEQLPWKSRDKYTILEAVENIVETPRIPGTYMAEREISNAYVDVVINGGNLRTSIDASIKRINRETKRKLIEFGYLDSNGNQIKEYKVPTLESIKEIIGIKE